MSQWDGANHKNNLSYPSTRLLRTSISRVCVILFDSKLNSTYNYVATVLPSLMAASSLLAVLLLLVSRAGIDTFRNVLYII